MEGDLLYYKGIVGGFKKIYAQIDSTDFVAFKAKPSALESKEILRLPLDKATSDESAKGITQVFLVEEKTNT
jgi:hypothetical protein